MRDQSESSERREPWIDFRSQGIRVIRTLNSRHIVTDRYYFGSLQTAPALEWSSGSIRRGLPGSSGITTHLSLTRRMGKHPSRKTENEADLETLILPKCGVKQMSQMNKSRERTAEKKLLTLFF